MDELTADQERLLAAVAAVQAELNACSSQSEDNLRERHDLVEEGIAAGLSLRAFAERCGVAEGALRQARFKARRQAAT